MNQNEEIKLKDMMSMQVGKGLSDDLCIKTNMKLELFGPDGELKETREVHNTVTTIGKQAVADQILTSPTLVKAGWMAI